DHEIMGLLDRAAVSFQVVLTKTDKPRPGALAKVLDALHADLARHAACFPEVLTTSSETGDGVGALRGVLEGLAAPVG
ncbi:MAG: YihA family ribosome biogenesis GTP-binding protein, partial [Pseudomonadota bacterium]